MKANSNLRIVCWQPILTEHQSETFAALAACEGVELTAVTSRADNRERPGWMATDARVSTERLPSRGWRKRIAALLADPDAVHIFASPFDRAKANVALIEALRRRRTVFLLSEPYGTVPVGYHTDRGRWLAALKYKLRPVLYRFYGTLLASRVAGVFAISPRAVAQFREMGFRCDRIYRFGYFVSGPPAGRRLTEQTRYVHDEGKLRCVFVGSLIERKGLKLAIDAFAQSSLLQTGATLDIYGSGGQPDAELPAGVTFGGRLTNAGVQQAMAQADLVVVPSLFDGWGVVVNEAILAGAGVIASDSVGAAAMVVEWQCGRTFPAGDGVALRRELEELAGDRTMVSALRKATGPLAAVLDPTVAGRHMNDCIRARLASRPPPTAPWYSIPE